MINTDLPAARAATAPDKRGTLVTVYPGIYTPGVPGVACSLDLADHPVAAYLIASTIHLSEDDRPEDDYW